MEEGIATSDVAEFVRRSPEFYNAAEFLKRISQIRQLYYGAVCLDVHTLEPKAWRTDSGPFEYVNDTDIVVELRGPFDPQDQHPRHPSANARAVLAAALSKEAEETVGLRQIELDKTRGAKWRKVQNSLRRHLGYEDTEQASDSP